MKTLQSQSEISGNHASGSSTQNNLRDIVHNYARGDSIPGFLGEANMRWSAKPHGHLSNKIAFGFLIAIVAIAITAIVVPVCVTQAGKSSRYDD